MFIAALFIIAKNSKQLKCLSTGEWILHCVNKLCNIQTIEYYSVIQEWSADIGNNVNKS